MLIRNNCKQEYLIRKVEKMKNIIRCIVFAVVAFCATNALAASSQTVTVNATVPTKAGGLSVKVSKVVGDVWTTASTISFGTLTWDPTNKIFAPDCYYAVDVSVEDNSGTAWTLTHTRAALANGSNNVNNKVNVSFMKKTLTGTETVDKLLSYTDSQNVNYTKTALGAGWLRIYYGIGMGNTAKPDATGVTPIGLDTPAGTYTGSVTITLTP
jgi:hypothetical protein